MIKRIAKQLTSLGFWLHRQKLRYRPINPRLNISENASREHILNRVQHYVASCVHWQAVQRKKAAKLKLEQEHLDKFGTRWLAHTRFRAPVVLLAYAITLLFCILIWKFLSLQENFPSSEWIRPNPVWSALLPLLLASPIAFWIWVFRDQNAQLQIDNQRKDINLKDFQKLCEWASGQHMLEGKSTESEKITKKTTDTGVITEVCNEITTATETTVLPNYSLGVSRQVGGESLQVAAIYQLQAFMAGEFGPHFERPTFQLYKSLWQGLIGPIVDESEEYWLRYLAEDFKTIDKKSLNDHLREWKRKVYRQAHGALGTALLQVLASNSGTHLARHAHDLPGAFFSGINSNHPGLTPWQLAGLNLTGIRLQGANLANAQLQGAKLSRAQLQLSTLVGVQAQGAEFVLAELQRANLSGANLQGASMQRARMHEIDLQEAKLQGADLSSARLHWADLESADLHAAILRNAKLQEANFTEAKLHRANLKFAQLQGADLTNAELFSTDLRGAEIDEKTVLSGVRYDASTQFGRLRPSGSRRSDADFIDSESEEQNWRERGARRKDE